MDLKFYFLQVHKICNRKKKMIFRFFDFFKFFSALLENSMVMGAKKSKYEEISWYFRRFSRAITPNGPKKSKNPLFDGYKFYVLDGNKI